MLTRIRQIVLSGSRGGFTPLSLSSLQTWLKADAALYQNSGLTTPATIDGDPVGGCPDFSGNNRPFTSSGTARPLLKTGIQNGKPGILMDGVNDLLSSPSFATFPAKRGTFFLVWKWVSGNNKGVIQTFNGTAPTWQLVTLGAGTSYSWYDGSTSRTIETLAIDRAHILVVRRTGDTTLTVNRDGWGPATYTIANNQHAANVVSIGGDTNGAGEYTNSYYFEWGFFSSDIGADNEWALIQYLDARWNVLSNSVITVSPLPSTAKNMIAFPAAAKLANNDILVAHMASTTEVGTGDNTIWSTRLTGQQLSWGAATLIVDDTASSLADFVNVGMMQAASGTILLPYVRQNVSGGVVTTIESTKLKTSTDNGVTWSAPGTVAVPAGYNYFYAYGRIIEVTSGGRLLMPGYGVRTSDNRNDVLILRSDDSGATWTLHGVIAGIGAGVLELTETAVICTGGTNFLGVARSGGISGGGLWTSTSTDGGATWSAAVLLTIGTDVSPDMILDGTDILLFYAHRTATHALRARRSTDGGATWGSDYEFYTHTSSVTGYPSAQILSRPTNSHIGLLNNKVNSLLRFDGFPKSIIP